RPRGSAHLGQPGRGAPRGHQRLPRCAAAPPAPVLRRDGRLRRLRRGPSLGEARGLPARRDRCPRPLDAARPGRGGPRRARLHRRAGRQRAEPQRHRRRRGRRLRRRPRTARDDAGPAAHPDRGRRGGVRLGARARPQGAHLAARVRAGRARGRPRHHRRRDLPGRPLPAAPLGVYRVLRRMNPRSYVYLLRTVDAEGEPIDVVGASPESLVSVRGTTATTHPIAGSRPRGATPEEDEALGAELLADPKERSEHLMLVDLARNDLQKFCAPGTVVVRDFMHLERFSHIQHIVSTVTGHLGEGVEAYDALRATFPAGTLSGAPKPSAMRIIDRLEPVRRGVYGGTVGYVDFAGDMDMAIAIRTAVIKGGTAHVQAGGGVVADSDATMEHRETQSKAAAALRAAASADTLRPA